MRAASAALAGVLTIASLVTQTVVPARADASFPSRPMLLVVPAPAGGSADYFARVLGPKIAAATRQTVTVDNKPGATGVIGARSVIGAAPDGYTVLLNSVASVVVGPHLSSPPAFDSLTDLTPIVPIATVPAILVVRPDLGIKTLDELIKYAKANPGKLNAASSGAGTLSSLNVALLQKETGIKLTHVPYKGAPPAINDMLGGHIDLMFSDVSFFMNHVKAGKMVALAAAAPARIAVLPDLPTTAELGYPKLLAANVYCLYGPPKMPQEVTAKLNKLVRDALNDPEVKTGFLRQSASVESMPAPEFAAMFKSEHGRFMSLLGDVASAVK